MGGGVSAVEVRLLVADGAVVSMSLVIVCHLLWRCRSRV